jgi:hypothetical protein
MENLDLTKQTITLGTEDQPHISLMLGHVDDETFVRAFHAEGWDNDGEPLTEEQVLEEITSSAEPLTHTYARQITDDDGQEGWRIGLEKHEVGAVPVTVRYW